MAARPTLLGVPPEIRLRICDYLFINRCIKIETGESESNGEEFTYSIIRIPLSAQLIRVCRMIHEETQHLLYSSNAFNCSSREGLKLFLQEIGPKNFANIKHIIIDWDQLQDFAWSLAKEENRSVFKYLQIVELATWRMRVLENSSFLWKQTKNYERQLCQSALEICQKHERLKIITQEILHKPGRADTTNARVKWRFLVSEDQVLDGETIVPIETELAILKAGQDTDSDMGSMRMIDPL